MLRPNTLLAPDLLPDPLPVLAVTIPNLNRAMCPEILVTLDPSDRSWHLKIPKGPIDFVVTDKSDAYSVKGATLTDISSNNGSAVSLAFSALFKNITPIGKEI